MNHMNSTFQSVGVEELKEQYLLSDQIFYNTSVNSKLNTTNTLISLSIGSHIRYNVGDWIKIPSKFNAFNYNQYPKWRWIYTVFQKSKRSFTYFDKNQTQIFPLTEDHRQNIFFAVRLLHVCMYMCLGHTPSDHPFTENLFR